MTTFCVQCKQHSDVAKRSNRNTPLSEPCKHHHDRHRHHHHLRHHHFVGWGPQWNGGRGCPGHCPSCHRKEEGGDDDDDLTGDDGDGDGDGDDDGDGDGDVTGDDH